LASSQSGLFGSGDAAPVDRCRRQKFFFSFEHGVVFAIWGQWDAQRIPTPCRAKIARTTWSGTGTLPKSRKTFVRDRMISAWPIASRRRCSDSRIGLRQHGTCLRSAPSRNRGAAVDSPRDGDARPQIIGRRVMTRWRQARSAGEIGSEKVLSISSEVSCLMRDIRRTQVYSTSRAGVCRCSPITAGIGLIAARNSPAHAVLEVVVCRKTRAAYARDRLMVPQ